MKSLSRPREKQWDRAESVLNNIHNGNLFDARQQLKKQSRRQRYITISCMREDLRFDEAQLWHWMRIVIEGDFS